MTAYQGHKNWNHWNVSMWINNHEPLYRTAQNHIRVNMSRVHSNRDQAARDMARELEGQSTPDGAPYSFTTIRAAMRGMEV